MAIVIVLIRAEAGKIWDACKAILKLEWIETADVVTGPYDIIAYAELPSTDDLRKLMENIHATHGITRTETCVAL